jgi:uncharacterized membrane protein YbhN (UPF0104 family)
VRFAIAAAVVVAASPHLARPLRYAGRWIVTAAAIGTLALGIASVGGVLGALALAGAAAAAVHLAFGSPGGRPNLQQVAVALEELGVTATRLHPAELQPEGVWAVVGTGPGGGPVTVKVYGRDAWDGQLAMSIWRFAWYRDGARSLTVTRVQQVEHEAFLTLLAGANGLAVPRVLAAGRVQSGDALLALTADTTPLGRLPEVPDTLLRDLWSGLAGAHAAGLSPGQIDLDRIGVDGDGNAAFLDWSAGQVVPTPPQMAQDAAQLLVSTALVAGVDPAITAAAAALGSDRFAEILSYAQESCLSPGLRRQARDESFDIDELRSRAAALVGVESPELVRLRRVTLGTVVQAALLLLAGTAMVRGLTSLDFAAVSGEFQEMAWGAAVAALVVAQLARASGALSTIGASPEPLPLGPVVELQFAIAYVNMAVPSTAGRVAVVMRFFQRAGASATTALGVGALDSLANFTVQIVLVATTLVLGLGSLELGATGSLDGMASSALRFLVITGGLLLVGGVVALLIPAVRRRVLPTLRDFRGNNLQVLRSPSNLALLLGGNLLSQILYSLTLGACAQAMGHDVGLVDLLLVINLVGTFASIIPVPNGIGVAEAGLTAGLVAVGVPESAAFAAALLHRVLTAYLPPIWGLFAMRSLQRRRYL